MENKRYNPFSKEELQELKTDRLYIDLEKRHQFATKLNFSELENDVFTAYLKGYLSLTDDPETAYMLRQPETEILRKFIATRWLVSIIEAVDVARIKTSKKYFNEALNFIENENTTNYSPIALRSLANLIASNYRKNEKLTISEQEKSMDRLISKYKVISNDTL